MEDDHDPRQKAIISYYDYDQKKKTGKRKIEIKPITNKTSKQVTFSKRRSGLFKKASELCTLCGAQVGIITFSGAGKLFSFGHPSIDTIIQRYINTTSVQNNDNNNNDDDNDDVNINNKFGKLSSEYKEVLSNIKLEKTMHGTNDVASSSTNGSTNNVHGGDSGNNNDKDNDNDDGFWWDKPIDDLGLFELEQLKSALEDLRGNVCSRVDENKRFSMSLMPPQSYNNVGSRDEIGIARDGYNGPVIIDSIPPALRLSNSLFGHQGKEDEGTHF